jgi:UDP-glucose 4-epimerase
VRVLVTGGAGFIGSNLVDALSAAGHSVRVLDDVSTGYAENVADSAELIQGDIADEAVVRKSVEGVEIIFHHAAHRAVLRSVTDPVATDRVNVHGTVTLLKAAVDAGVRRVVSASSSSVYGGAKQLPTPETAPLMPRSPYAVTKVTGEHYCRVFTELYGLETVALRYFNIFGPRQRPDSAYAAVIPLFIEALIRDQRPCVHGDGLQSRAFTYIDDAIAANLAAAAAPAASCAGRAYNIAGAESVTLLDLLASLGRTTGITPEPIFVEPRAGDVRASAADISAARLDLGFRPTVSFEEGLRRTAEWVAGRVGA